MKKPSTFNFILHVFLEILQRHCKVAVFGTWGLSGYAYPKWHYHLVENIYVYLQAKNQPHPPSFYGDIAKICKLILGTLGMPGYTHQKWWYHLAEDFDDIYLFICMQKINFIIHFFLMILHFKESCNLIGWQHFGP